MQCVCAPAQRGGARDRTGATYRVDSERRIAVFHQVEGLWLRPRISFADSEGVYTDFCTLLRDRRAAVRFARPTFVTEPSAEIDMIVYQRVAHGPLARDFRSRTGASGRGPELGFDPERTIGSAFGSGWSG